MAVTAAIVGSVAAVAGAGATIYNSQKQTKAAKNAADQTAQQNAKIEQEAKDQQVKDEAARAQEAARARQRAIAASSGGQAGYSGTILTSPLGLTGQSSSAGRTLGGT